MTIFEPAFNYMMSWEDPQRKYAVEPDRCPEGCAGPCFAISGVNSGSWPGDFLAIQASHNRAQAVEGFYLEKFWQPMGLASLSSQGLANRVFDQGVNGGAQTAIRLLQEAANGLGGALTVDGGLGPLTITAVNALDPSAILTAYRNARAVHYRKIVAEKPADAPDLAGWLDRAEA